jgi:hypothetical protein
MEYLQRPTRREGLAPAIAHIQKGTAPVPETNNPEAGYKKKEANAISGYFMVPIWAQAKQWMTTHPGEMGTYRRNEKGRKPLVVESLQTLQENSLGDPQKLLLDLYQASHDTLAWHVSRFVKNKEKDLKNMETAGAPREEWPRDAQIFARYTTLLEEGVELQDFRVDPKKLLQTGFMAAEVVSWATIEGIPRMYREHFGQSISDDDLAQYLEKGRMMALYMASMHIDVFRPFVGEILSRDENDPTKPKPIFNGSVKLDPEGKFPFSIDKEALRKIAREVEKIPQLEGPRTGCPAIAARDANGNNLVTDIYKSAVALAEQYYFPVAVRERGA